MNIYIIIGIKLGGALGFGFSLFAIVLIAAGLVVFRAIYT